MVILSHLIVDDLVLFNKEMPFYSIVNVFHKYTFIECLLDAVATSRSVMGNVCTIDGETVLQTYADIPTFLHLKKSCGISCCHRYHFAVSIPER